MSNDTCTEDEMLGMGFCNNPICDYGNGEFCGSDNVCHPYSCEDWYEFGPPCYTGNTGGTLLQCISISVPEQTIGHSVVYACGGFSNFVDLPFGPDVSGVGLKFTESCIARNTKSNTTFECLQLRSVIEDTDRINAFIAAANNSTLTCANATEPKFIYQVDVTSFQFSGSYYGNKGSNVFNETMASRTITSKLSEGLSVSSSSSTESKSCLWLLIGITLLVFWR
jgi:hypothetical protein